MGRGDWFMNAMEIQAIINTFYEVEGNQPNIAIREETDVQFQGMKYEKQTDTIYISVTNIVREFQENFILKYGLSLEWYVKFYLEFIHLQRNDALNAKK